MRFPTPPSPTIVSLLAPFSNLFTPPNFTRFTDHLTCLMTWPSPACITDVQRCAQDLRHYSRHRDFLAHCPISPHHLLATASRSLGLLERTTRLSHGREVLVCALDDTLRRRAFSPKLFGADWHHDHAASPGQQATCWGQNLVLLSVIPEPFDQERVRSHIVDFEPWIPVKACLEDRAGSLAYDTKANLGAWMLKRQLEHLPSPCERLVVTDSLYAKAPFLLQALSQPDTHVIGRLAHNRVVYHPPPPRQPGQRGAPRKYGQKVDWKAEFEEHAKPMTLKLYGKTQTARVWAMTGRVTKIAQDVRLVMCQLSKASRPSLFVSTDTTLTDQDILELYAARFSIEEAIRDLVCELALGQERSRGEEVYQMQIALRLVAAMLLDELSRHQPDQVVEALRDPWRKRRRRPTLGQVKQGLRWECWSGQTLFRRISPGTRAREKARGLEQADVA